MIRAIVLDSADNVATLLATGKAGDTCVLQGERSGEVSLVDDIAFGHKICILATASGSDVRKYGQVIGKAIRAIERGGAHPRAQHRIGAPHAPRKRR